MDQGGSDQTIRPSPTGSESPSFHAPPLASEIEIGQVLARGASGEVLRARQIRLGRPLAVKRPCPPSPARNASLLREARIASRLEHRAIIPIHGLYQGAEGEPVLAMKLLTGPRWATRIHAPSRPMPPQDLDQHVRIAVDVAMAMSFAHRQGVLHLDLKPANVLEGEVGDVHVVDWSVALDRNTEDDRRDELLGSPSYVAPEMVVGGQLDERTDVYLLGGCLYEALHGAPPHRRATPEASAAAASEPVPFRASADPELRGIIERALALAPHERWQDMEQLRQALEGYLAHQSSLQLVRQAHRLLDGAKASEAHDALYELDAAEGQLDAALELWPDNPEALALRQELDRSAFDLHLARGNLDIAERLLGTLGEDPTRTEQLASAHARRAASRAATDRLGLQRWLEDPDLGARRRGLVLVAAWLPIASVSLLALWMVPSAAPSPPDKQLGFVLLVLVLWTGGRFVARRLVPDTYTNLALAGSVTAVLVGATAHRMGCWLADADPVALVQGDLLVMGTAFASFDTDRRGMFVLCALCYAGALAMAYEPSIARAVFLSILFTFPLFIAPSMLSQGPR